MTRPSFSILWLTLVMTSGLRAGAVWGEAVDAELAPDPRGSLVERSGYLGGQRSGVRLTYWPSGAKRTEESWTEGHRIGTSRHWSREGQLVRQARYDDAGNSQRSEQWQDGEQVWVREPVTIDGYGEGWKIVETSGKIVETEIRAEGYLLRTRYSGDTLTDRAEMVNGSYQGLYVSTSSTDHITTRVHFVDGEEEGLYTRVWNGQELERGHYSHGKRVGDWMRREHSTRIVHETYNDQGNLDGVQETRMMGGPLTRRASYVDGTLDGPYAEYDADGALLSGGFYVAGQKDGAWREGTRHHGGHSEGRYERGRKQGRWVLFDHLGYIREVTTWRDGQKNGPGYLLTESGALREVRMWRQNQRDGYTTYYDRTGPVAHDLWRDGQLEATGLPVEAAPAGTTDPQP